MFVIAQNVMFLFLCSFSPQPGSTVELSQSAYQFLTDLFNKYDKVGGRVTHCMAGAASPFFLWGEVLCLFLTCFMSGKNITPVDQEQLPENCMHRTRE